MRSTWFRREVCGQYDSWIEYECCSGDGTLNVRKSAPGEYVWVFEVHDSEGHHGHSVRVHVQRGKAPSLSGAKLAAKMAQSRYTKERAV